MFHFYVTNLESLALFYKFNVFFISVVYIFLYIMLLFNNKKHCCTIIFFYFFFLKLLCWRMLVSFFLINRFQWVYDSFGGMSNNCFLLYDHRLLILAFQKDFNTLLLCFLQLIKNGLLSANTLKRFISTSGM